MFDVYNEDFNTAAFGPLYCELMDFGKGIFGLFEFFVYLSVCVLVCGRVVATVLLEGFS